MVIKVLIIEPVVESSPLGYFFDHVANSSLFISWDPSFIVFSLKLFGSGCPDVWLIDPFDTLGRSSLHPIMVKGARVTYEFQLGHLVYLVVTIFFILPASALFE